MEEKTLNYSVHANGELKKVIECPAGTYYADEKHGLYHFKPAEGYEDAIAAELTILLISSAHNNEIREKILELHEKFERIPEKFLTEEENSFSYNFQIDGSMVPFVVSKEYGILYGDHDKKVFFFDSKYKEFMTQVLKNRFFEGIERDLESNSPKIKVGAAIVMDIYHNWVELDEEDIIR